MEETMNTKIIIPPFCHNHILITKLIAKLYRLYPIIINKDVIEIIRLGELYSPNNMCLTFKYELGYIIESIRNGGNIYLEIQSGCKTSNYIELIEQIITELGYKMHIEPINSKNKISLIKMYKSAKKYNKKLTIIKYIYYLLEYTVMTLLRLIAEDIKNKKQLKTSNQDEFENNYNTCLDQIYKFNLKEIIKSLYILFKTKPKSIQNTPPKEILVIGTNNSIISMLLYQKIELSLIKNGILVNQHKSIRNNIIERIIYKSKIKVKIQKYLKYSTKEEIIDLYNVINYKKENLGGIIFIRINGCFKGLNSLKIIESICNNKKIPLLLLNPSNSQELVKIIETI